MTLTFLGQPYQPNSTETPQPGTQAIGNYRGAVLHLPTTVVAQRSNLKLTYRGVEYVS
ncbi:MAG TPA: DUF4278 domain-containing protein [Leptolyngbyaceae cyanobacterium M33_DOE_097]|nr:DUF4278 domain-containing protein [Leptolyngbyaceae cyanobacterium M33_DOE_097]